MMKHSHYLCLSILLLTAVFSSGCMTMIVKKEIARNSSYENEFKRKYVCYAESPYVINGLYIDETSINAELYDEYQFPGLLANSEDRTLVIRVPHTKGTNAIIWLCGVV